MPAYPPRRFGRILPRQNHRVPEPERNLGGGRERSSGERIWPTRGAAWAWQSIKGTQILSLASQSFLAPAAASSRCSGIFFFFFPSWEGNRDPQRGEKPCGIANHRRRKPKRQRGLDPIPPREAVVGWGCWGRGDQGCCGGMGMLQRGDRGCCGCRQGCLH